MPIYEYQCKSCCHCFEKLILSPTDTPSECPQCACKEVIKMMSAATVRSQGIPTGSGGFKEPACKPSG